METEFYDEGHDGRRYVVVEYSGAGAIFVYNGFYNGGNTITLYPKHSLCKGLKRGKIDLPVQKLKKRRF